MDNTEISATELILAELFDTLEMSRQLSENEISKEAFLDAISDIEEFYEAD